MMRRTFAFVLLAAPAFGLVTHPSPTAEVEAIQELHDSDAVQDGHTITVPAGLVTWSTPLIITKAITLRGAGVGNTIIQDATLTSPTLISWVNTRLGQSYRLTGFEFRHLSGANADNAEKAKFRINGLSQAVRVDSCKFDMLRGVHFRVAGGVYGVIDSSEFNVYGGSRIIMALNGNADGRAYGDGAWENPAEYFSSKAIYLEDNDIVRLSTEEYGIADGWNGCRIVIRENRLKHTRLTVHGTESSQRLRGGRLLEVYNNEFVSDLAFDAYVEIRSGTARVFNNTLATTKNFNAFVRLANYRNQAAYVPWGSVDGTWLWDSPDLTDDETTPGGAGDGVFAIGTVASSSKNVVVVAGEPWEDSQWNDHLLRVFYNFTANTGSGVRKIEVEGAGWSLNQWAGWEFYRPSDGVHGKVSSNDENTITLSTSMPSVTIADGDVVQIYRATEIKDNDSNTLHLYDNSISSGPRYVFSPSATFEIRRVVYALDQPGRGVSSPITGSPPANQSISQGTDPVYMWSNTINGNPANYSNGGYGTIRKDRDFFIEADLSIGARGVGVGPVASRPTSGFHKDDAWWDPSSGEWNSDHEGPDGQLYIATSDNVWGEPVTPYPYPHPLRVDDFATAPPIAGIATPPQAGTIGVRRR